MNVINQNRESEYLFKGEVNISVDNLSLKGDLIIPHNAKSIVIFCHGSGSSRASSRNQKVANFLHQKHFGSLLFDLLTETEDQNYQNRFNIDLLAHRLTTATKWLEKLPVTKGYSFGFFGASTGAASALMAATTLSQIRAIVSRGGRPDLAMKVIHLVKAPTLLIVGSMDKEVLELNNSAYEQLKCEKKLEVIPGATHLFEEKGTMDEVCKHAGAWFEKYMPA